METKCPVKGGGGMLGDRFAGNVHLFSLLRLFSGIYPLSKLAT